MRAGFERSPRSIASRVLSASWFLFALILLLSYMASLVNLYFWAGIVHPNFAPRFDSLDDVVRDTDYKVGALSSGQAFHHIRNANIGRVFDILRHAWAADDGLLVSSNEEGFRRARTEKYAFISESPIAKYVTQRKPCDLTTVREGFAQRGYGLALPVDSPYMALLNLALLDLIETGELVALERKWWYDMGECSLEGRESTQLDGVASALCKAGGPRSVNLRALSAAFLLLLAGIVVSVLVGAAELFYFRKCGQVSASTSASAYR